METGVETGWRLRWRLLLPQASMAVPCGICAHRAQGTGDSTAKTLVPVMDPRDYGVHAQGCNTYRVHAALSLLWARYCRSAGLYTQLERVVPPWARWKKARYGT